MRKYESMTDFPPNPNVPCLSIPSSYIFRAKIKSEITKIPILHSQLGTPPPTDLLHPLNKILVEV